MSFQGLLQLVLLWTNIQALQLTQKSCEGGMKIDNNFIGYPALNEIVTNYTEILRAKQKTAYDIVLIHYERARTDINGSCLEFDTYLNIIDANLRECGLINTKNKRLHDEIERSVIYVLYNLHQKERECVSLWDTLRSPVDCSAFGYERKIRDGCSDLIAKIGSLQVDLYNASDKTECCFSNKVKLAEKSIMDIVNKCNT